MCQSLLAVETLCVQPAVAQHLEDLSVFLAFLLEGQLSLLVVVFVLASTPILTTLFDRLKSAHVGCKDGEVMAARRRYYQTYLSLVLRHIELCCSGRVD